MSKWTKDSWKNCDIKHIPEYKDQNELDEALERLSTFPPLVFAGECKNLKLELA